MKKKITLIFIIIATILFAQSDKKKLMMKQANRYNIQRSYEKANEIYQQLMIDYPDDYKIPEKLFNNYLISARFKEAEELLKAKSDIIPEDNLFLLELRILLSQSETRIAEKRADKYIKRNKGRIQIYRNIAQIFEGYRQYEKSVEIMLLARDAAKDDYLYARELALDYEFLKNYPRSIQENLRYLEKNTGFYYYVKSRFKNILRESPHQIEEIRKVAKKSKSEKVHEVFAYALAEIEDYEAALEEYSNLSVESLRKFAMDMQKIAEYEIALQALQIYMNKAKDANLKADVKINIGKIFLEQGDLDNAETILLDVYHDEKLQSKRIRYRTKAGKECRQLLAKIALTRREPDKVVLTYLKEALANSFNKNDKDEVIFDIIEFQINSGKFGEAKKGITEIYNKEDMNNSTCKTANYYKFLISLMEDKADADTLLSELLVMLPESELTNNALFLGVIAGGLDATSKQAFMQAYRKMNLMQGEEAVEILLEANHLNPQEELYFLAGEWAALIGNIELAESVFLHQFNNEVLAEYARLRTVELNLDAEKENELIRSFLIDKNQSVFAPAFRILMEN